MSNVLQFEQLNENRLKILDKVRYYENLVVGMLLFDSTLINIAPLDISMFRTYGNVVKAIVDLFKNDVKPDLLTVCEAIQAGNELFTELAILVRNVPSTANYRYYLEQMERLTLNIKLYHDGMKYMRQIEKGDLPSDVMPTMIESALSLAATGCQSKFNYNSSELAESVLDKLEAAYENKGKATLVKTGIAKVDGIIGSFNSTDFVVVGARPAVGKTAFAVTMSNNLSLEGLRVGFFSTEMSHVEIGKRINSQLSGINSFKYKNSDFSPREWSLVSNAASVFSKTKFRIFDKPAITVGEIVMQSRAWSMDGGLDVIIIDYLTRIRHDKQFSNQNLKVGDIATELKNLARTLNVPVIALAQLNRDAAGRLPTMADLRDSGIIEQEADAILLLHREENESFVIVEKNRHGEADYKLSVAFEKTTGRWS
jgi:replicative DNA helicase